MAMMNPRIERQISESNVMTHKWTLKRFVVNEPEKTYRSPYFFTNDGDIKWWLDFRVNTNDSHSALVLEFEGIPVNLPFIQTYFHVWVSDSKNVKRNYSNFQVAFESVHEGGKFMFEFVSIDSLIEWNMLYGDDFEIEFQILTIPSVGGFLKTQHRLNTEVFHIWKDNRFSDVVIQVTHPRLQVVRRVFYGHKAILAARSGFFADHFENETKMNPKSDTKSIVYIEWSSKLIEAMLNFIYVGEIDKILDIAMKLLETSYCFKVKTLNDVCLDTLATMVTVKSVIEILTAADSFTLEQTEKKLKIRCLDFIKENRNEVTQTSSFLFLQTTSQNLIEEIKNHMQSYSRQ